MNNFNLFTGAVVTSIFTQFSLHVHELLFNSVLQNETTLSYSKSKCPVSPILQNRIDELLFCLADPNRFFYFVNKYLFL